MSSQHGPAQRIIYFLVGLVAKWLIGLYYMTVRIVESPASLAALNRDPRPPGIRPFWHSHQLSALWHYRRTRTAILISRSRDGEYIARVAQSVGFIPVRGSSSRSGAAGLKAMIRRARAGHAVAFTPDGPLGPRHTIHGGTLRCAQKAGLPIVPFALGLSSFWELRSWDRFRIPKPFSRGYACWGEPLHVPADADDAELEELAGELQRRMIALERHADQCAAQLAER